MPQPDELLEPLDNVIKADPIFVPDRASPRRIRFALSEWQELPELNSSPPEKWTRSKRNLLFELQAHRSSQRINIHLILGPSEDAFRKYIFSEACKLPSIFLNPTKPLGKDTSAIYARDLLSDGSASKMSDEAKAAELLAAWKNFVNHDLVSLRSEIARLVESYREQASKPKAASST
jgi:hypothetical protein